MFFVMYVVMPVGVLSITGGMNCCDMLTGPLAGCFLFSAPFCINSRHCFFCVQVFPVLSSGFALPLVKSGSCSPEVCQFWTPKGPILHLRKQQLTSANYTLMRMYSGWAHAHATWIQKFTISPVLMFSVNINRSSKAVATCMILHITLLPRWINSGIIRHRCSY